MDSTASELLKSIVMAMVEDKDQVKVDCNITSATAVCDVYISARDFGVVMGKDNSHITSLRRLFKVIYGRMGKRLYLQVIDPRRPE